MQAIQLLLSGRIDSKTAGLLLYALQTASLNLRQTDLEPCIHERVVIDPRSVDETPLGENSWDEEDFEEENDEEEEDSDDDDGSDDEEEEDDGDEEVDDDDRCRPGHRLS